MAEGKIIISLIFASDSIKKKEYSHKLGDYNVKEHIQVDFT